MSKIGIIVAMEEEIRCLKEAMTIEKTENIYSSSYYQGQLSGQEVVLVQSGIGKVNATISAAVLIDRFEVSSVINTGSAGAVADNLKVGDIVLGEALVYHDADLTAFGYGKGQMSGMPATYRADDQLLTLAQKVVEKQGQKIYCGLIASGDQFVNDSGAVAKIKENFPTCLSLEMESAAIGQTCYVMDRPCLVIRSISDTADHDAGMTFDEFVVLAGQRSANLLIELLKELK